MAKKNDSLGDRMKGYEGVSRNFLTRRVPAIIRLDGKAFHTFTKGMEKPFDLVLTQAMQETMKYLCENIQGCVLGYTQSDGPSVTAYGNFLAEVARIVDGFFKPPFNATETALQLCGEIVPVNASLRPKHFLNHVAGLFVQLVMAKVGLTYGLNTVSGCVLLPPDQTVTDLFFWDRENAGVEHGSEHLFLVGIVPFIYGKIDVNIDTDRSPIRAIVGKPTLSDTFKLPVKCHSCHRRRNAAHVLNVISNQASVWIVA